MRFFVILMQISLSFLVIKLLVKFYQNAVSIDKEAAGEVFLNIKRITQIQQYSGCVCRCPDG